MKTHICEVCGKETDGSYGSGRFCSLSCRMTFIAKKSADAKKQHSFAKPNARSKYGTWKCNYCNFIGQTRRELEQHKHDMHNVHKAWNKGLTAETSDVVKRTRDSLRKTITAGKFNSYWKGKHIPREIVAKQSATRIKNGNSGGPYGGGRGKKGWYKGFWCDSSWELAWVIYSLEHNIKFERYHGFFKYEFNGKVHKYYPDFLLEDGTIIEIKGFSTAQWNAKVSQLPKNVKLVLLNKEMIQPYLKYVTEKYGKDFVRLYEK